MARSYQINDAARSLDQQQFLDWLRGWQVVNPGGGSNAVSEGTGDFEYDIDSGDINAGGTIVTCTAGSVDFASDIGSGDDDKMAVIYRDASGNAQKAVGSPNAQDPDGADPRNTHTPPPPTLHNTNGVVLAEVLLPAGASSIGADEFRDRRDPAAIVVGRLDAILGGTLDADGNDITGVGALTAGNIGNVRRVYQGEDAQAALDGLPSADRLSQNVVYLDPQGQFDAIDVPDYTSVYLNGAAIKPQSDVPGIDLSGEACRAYGPGIVETFQVDGYSSGAITVDTDGLSNTLEVQNRNTVEAIGIDIYNPGADGIGLLLASTSTSISVGNRFVVNTRTGQDGIVIDTKNGNHINGPQIWTTVQNPDRDGIVHRNSAGSAAGARVLVRGTVEPLSGAAHIQNETAQTPSIEFHGQVWDPHVPTTAIDGPGLRVWTENNVDASHVSFGTGTVVNGMGQESANAETPSTGVDYRVGDVVDFTDSDDGSGTGVYMLLADDTWSQIGT